MRTCRVFSLLMMWCASLLFAQSTSTDTTGASVPPQPPALCNASTVPNVNQLALLRWYGANVVSTFVIGGRPNGLAFG